jgi:hypothetical protein
MPRIQQRRRTRRVGLKTMRRRRRQTTTKRLRGGDVVEKDIKTLQELKDAFNFYERFQIRTRRDNQLILYGPTDNYCLYAQSGGTPLYEHAELHKRSGLNSKEIQHGWDSIARRMGLDAYPWWMVRDIVAENKFLGRREEGEQWKAKDQEKRRRDAESWEQTKPQRERAAQEANAAIQDYKLRMNRQQCRTQVEQLAPYINNMNYTWQFVGTKPDGT